ncbi:hypothetical protein O1L60_17640 [Streptomyces diastatochromogenes]|nr:hypothetical protein [Streptomyces diastatochromogenes]
MADHDAAVGRGAVLEEELGAMPEPASVPAPEPPVSVPPAPLVGSSVGRGCVGVGVGVGVGVTGGSVGVVGVGVGVVPVVGQVSPGTQTNFTS